MDQTWTAFTRNKHRVYSQGAILDYIDANQIFQPPVFLLKLGLYSQDSNLHYIHNDQTWTIFVRIKLPLYSQ